MGVLGCRDILSDVVGLWGYNSTREPFGSLCLLYDVGVLGCRDILSDVVGLWGLSDVGRCWFDTPLRGAQHLDVGGVGDGAHIRIRGQALSF